MERFEYKVIEIGKNGILKSAPDTALLQTELNKLGSMGWDMVGCIATSKFEGETRSAIAILKRIRSYET